MIQSEITEKKLTEMWQKLTSLYHDVFFDCHLCSLEAFCPEGLCLGNVHFPKFKEIMEAGD